MAVVISDFEVVAEPPPAAPAPAPGGDSEESPVLRPDEFDLLAERQAERAARVRAH